MANKNLAQRYLEAWNSHDPDRVLSFFANGATYIDSGLHSQVSGSRVGDHVERILDICPDASFELLDGGSVGNGRAVIQWRARGDNLSSWCPQVGLPSLDTLCGLDYITYERGKLISTHVYFDLAPLLSPSSRPLSTQSQTFTDANGEAIASGTGQYQKSGLTDQEVESYRVKVHEVMLQEHLYLDNDLTLTDLAEQLNLSTNHLSQVINSGFNLSFYELLNRYRIEQAKHLIKALPADEKMISLEIAFASGFGSASAYYRAFQRYTHMTPNEYRKRYG